MGARAVAAEGAPEDEADEEPVEWLPLEGVGTEEEATGASSNASLPSSRPRTLPLILVDDVFVPTAAVCLKVASPADCRLYEDLLFAGGRFVVAALRRPAEPAAEAPATAVAAFGTLLYLEDLREVSGATEGEAKYVAEHRAVGRARLLRLARRGPYLVAAAESPGDDEPLSSAAPSETLDARLEELAELQRRAGGARAGEASAAELAAALAAPRPAPALIPLQGLWRAASGTRVRVDGDDACGLGRLEATAAGEVALRLGRGGGEFRAEAEGGEELGSPATVLRWDDDDVWTRIAGPPPYSFDPFGAAGALWRAVRRWRELGSWRAEARRGEARFRSAGAIAQSLQGATPADPLERQRAEAAAAEEWRRASLGADEAAAGMRWEEVLRPCQRLLQAGSQLERLEVFCGILAMDAAKLRLRKALEEADPLSEAV